MLRVMQSVLKLPRHPKAHIVAVIQGSFIPVLKIIKTFAIYLSTFSRDK